MKRVLLCGPSLVRTLLVIFIVGGFPLFGAENSKKKGELPFFTWDLLWTGSWYNSVKTSGGGLPPADDIFGGGTLYNRGDFSLGLPKPDLSFRFLATDKRLLPPREDDGKAGFDPGAGVYHHGSGSRFLYGVQNEYGLPARIKNVWLRSVPFMDSRSPSSRDLKAEPSAQDKPESYLYLALPQTGSFGAFASAALDEERNPAFGGGLALDVKNAELRFEGFYTQKELPPRKVSTWFSSTPPLPERNFDIYALGLIFNSPNAAFATDWALSETFAWGRGIYGNAGLRIGNKPWRFSLAGDGAGSRFADRSGATAGAGFRAAAKLERFWPRSGLLRFQGTFRSPAMDESFNRGAVSVYYRPSAPSAAERKRKTFPIRLSRASISLNRDARDPGKTADTLDALTGFYIGPLSSVFSCSLHSVSSLNGNDAPLFRTPVFENYESFKVACELGLKPGIFDLKTKLAYTVRAKKDPLWEPSLNVSVRPGKWGRVGLKIASTDFPEKWNYTLSWRFEYR